jgi:plasmid stabilization system protein ParE
MTFLVRLSPRAEQQLYESALWWAENRSSRQALEWLDGFNSRLRDLENDPDSFPLAPESVLTGRDIRQITYGLSGQATHRAVFITKPGEVIIHAIKHLSQDDLTAEDF